MSKKIMRLQLEEIYPQILQNSCCDTVTRPKIGVAENDDKRAFVVQDEHANGVDFWLINPTSRVINFLAIDKCIFFDAFGAPKRCDFLVFSDVEACFVELSKADVKHRKEKRQIAIQQLAQTILTFREAGVQFEGLQLSAVVSLKAKKIYPTQTSAKGAAQKEFMDKYAVRLLEGNEFTLK